MAFRWFRRISAALLFLTPVLTQAAPQPQARTFVSAKKGSDSANCGRTSPCRTFNRAIALTSPGGEVVALDSGGYGAVTISQAVTLEAPDGVYAGMTVSAGDGITVAAGASDVIVLRGLTVVGAGTSGNGVTIASAGTVHVEHCTIRGFAAGNGIFATQYVFQYLYVADTDVSECNVGVKLAASTLLNPGPSTATIDRSHFAGSLTAGLFVASSENPIYVALADCTIRGGSIGIFAHDVVRLQLNRCEISNNSNTDLEATGDGPLIYLTSSVIASLQSNGGILQSSTSQVCSSGNNFILGGGGSINQCPLR